MPTGSNAATLLCIQHIVGIRMTPFHKAAVITSWRLLSQHDWSPAKEPSKWTGFCRNQSIGIKIPRLSWLAETWVSAALRPAPLKSRRNGKRHEVSVHCKALWSRELNAVLRPRVCRWPPLMWLRLPLTFITAERSHCISMEKSPNYNFTAPNQNTEINRIDAEV